MLIKILYFINMIKFKLCKGLGYLIKCYFILLRWYGCDYYKRVIRSVVWNCLWICCGYYVMVFIWERFGNIVLYDLYYIGFWYRVELF